MYLALAVDRCADYGNTCARWAADFPKAMNLFSRQAIAMTWDFPETAMLDAVVGGFTPAVKFIANCTKKLVGGTRALAVASARQQDARTVGSTPGRIFSTDPPYYDNIAYADLADFFYVWLRRSLRPLFPDLFSTLAVPKAEELVATPYRHESVDEADNFFLRGMTNALRTMAGQSHVAFPVTIYYAFKQAEMKGDSGTVSTGWESFLDAVISAGFGITGTWPMRTELRSRMVGMHTNALASSVILVCRSRPLESPTASRRQFVDAIKDELPPTLIDLQKAGIAPVDMAQAAIGPGMAVFTRYSRVNHSSGKRMTVGEALAVINEVLDETLEEQEGEFDGTTRWAVVWFKQYHFDEGDFDMANTLAMAKNVGIEALVEAGIIRSGGGRVRLLRPEELPEDWDPATDRRLTVWKTMHHLVRVLDGQGESAAAQLFHRVRGLAETARSLAHLLYAVSDRQKRPAEARPYNALVRSWPEIARLAREEQGGRRTLL